ncbi:hypothetical protein B0H12DRAFT_1076129 [Mycena haematopus]|nr:hypothetical protein B0H12DRAFT_1076129 [Mycena haematopus]
MRADYSVAQVLVLQSPTAPNWRQARHDDGVWCYSSVLGARAFRSGAEERSHVPLWSRAVLSLPQASGNRRNVAWRAQSHSEEEVEVEYVIVGSVGEMLHLCMSPANTADDVEQGYLTRTAAASIEPMSYGVVLIQGLHFFLQSRLSDLTPNWAFTSERGRSRSVPMEHSQKIICEKKGEFGCHILRGQLQKELSPPTELDGSAGTDPPGRHDAALLDRADVSRFPEPADVS